MNMNRRKKSGNEKIVYILHCVDAEGPLYESLEATFERLNELFGISMEPGLENLKKIQKRLIDFGDRTGIIADTFSSHNLDYNDSWKKIDKMLLKIMSPDFRNKMPDSFGNPWIYNWHCVDHVGYVHNPRRRTMGIHKIFDYYKQIIEKTQSYNDGIHWHFHPMSHYKEAHRCATSFINSPHLYEILCRRIIERNWFPVVFRAGFHTERPDSNLFLEQWIPFDASNRSYCKEEDNLTHHLDISAGRMGDWRLAPDDWSIYHPDHDYYQKPGNCRRWICRVLPIRMRNIELSQTEVDKAFSRANGGKPTIMCITNHDERDIAPEVDLMRKKITKASKKYPDVKFKFCEAKEAFRSAIYGKDACFEPVELGISLDGNHKRLILRVETKRGKVFGPQPFLAVKTKSGRFIHDNFDFDPTLRKWSYTFDHESIHADDLSAVGIATNDKYGNSFIKVINV
jgi:hypothetical protein